MARPLPPASKRRVRTPLPAYRYVPGREPHPFRHPMGHGLLRDVHPPPPLWPYGLDLFDHAYYWEAHEVWEQLWRRTDALDPRRQLLQGLIQAAASVLKGEMGQTWGARRLRDRAVLRLSRLGSACCRGYGIDSIAFIDDLERYHRGGPLPRIHHVS